MCVERWDYAPVNIDKVLNLQTLEGEKIMKIKKCDVCEVIKDSPITSLSLPIIPEDELILKRFDLCPECLELIGAQFHLKKVNRKREA